MVLIEIIFIEIDLKAERLATSTSQKPTKAEILFRTLGSRKHMISNQSAQSCDDVGADPRGCQIHPSRPPQAACTAGTATGSWVARLVVAGRVG
jgi:hypothetical protein